MQLFLHTPLPEAMNDPETQLVIDVELGGDWYEMRMPLQLWSRFLLGNELVSADIERLPDAEPEA
jgi:hypothetical protein